MLSHGVCLGIQAASTFSEPQRDTIYEQIRELMAMQGSLSVERMCQLATVSRGYFYSG